MRFGLVVLGVLVIVGTSAAAAPAWRTYEDEGYGWKLRYPQRFHFERIAIDGRYSQRGASIANFDAPMEHHPLSAFDVPAEGVVVRFWTSNGPPSVVFPFLERETPLPLSLASFERPSWMKGARMLRRLESGGVVLGAAVWFGPRVSAQDQADAARVVASFRPRAIEGGWLDRHGLVLEKEDAYPVGSVRRYDPSATRRGIFPFYLVRGRRAFYALSAGQTMAAGPTRCDVRLDRRAFEFFCPSGDRWDRLGRVIRYAGSKSRASERLSGHLVTVAYNGRVVVWTNSIAGPRPRAWD